MTRERSLFVVSKRRRTLQFSLLIIELAIKENRLLLPLKVNDLALMEIDLSLLEIQFSLKQKGI